MKKTLVGLAIAGLFTFAACDLEETETPSKETRAEAVPKKQAKEQTLAKKPKSTLTTGQEQALRAAESYLELMSFSKKGLIEQLSSEYGEGFSVEDATFAANNVGANWKEEAAEAAQSYLDSMAFSRQGLIDQLTSEYGEGFTLEQATYGVDQTGL